MLLEWSALQTLRDQMCSLFLFSRHVVNWHSWPCLQKTLGIVHCAASQIDLASSGDPFHLRRWHLWHAISLAAQQLWHPKGLPKSSPHWNWWRKKLCRSLHDNVCLLACVPLTFFLRPHGEARRRSIAPPVAQQFLHVGLALSRGSAPDAQAEHAKRYSMQNQTDIQIVVLSPNKPKDLKVWWVTQCPTAWFPQLRATDFSGMQLCRFVVFYLLKSLK